MSDSDLASGSQIEAARLEALHRLKILDSAAEEKFDRITTLATRHFGVPVARISFIDEERTWFKSSVGMKDTQAPRAISFCSSTIENSEVLVVHDLSKDPRFAERPQVTGGPQFRFYVGVPIGPAAGLHVGTLCLMDHVPHADFNEADTAFLVELAAILNDELESRWSLLERTRELNAREERLALAMSSATDGLWDWDLRSREIHYSPRWCSMLGFTPDEVQTSVDFGWGRFVDDGERDRVFGLVNEFVDGNIDEFETEYRMRHKDGSCLWVRCRAFLVEEGGEPIRLVGTHVDISEQKRLEEVLRQAQKMEVVAQLTGGVAHDFNNLLGVIVGNAELLELDHGANEGTTTILEAAAHGKELIGRLLSFSRNQPLNPQATDLQHLVRDMVDMLARALGEAVRIERQFAPDLANVLVDQGQMENAVLNLAVNARDAMPRGGTLTIACRNVEQGRGAHGSYGPLPPGNYVEIALTDEGEGMSDEIKAQVFDPFFTTKRMGEGSGLGLSMVYGFVEQSGGAVAIDSVEGRGTTVRICLPATAESVSPHAQSGAELDHQGNGARLLVIEDDLEIRALCVATLQDLGYQVLDAADSSEACRILDEYDDIEVVVCDVVLADGSTGPEFLSRQLRRRPDVRVVFVSGYQNVPLEGIHGPLADALRNVLPKPFKRVDLAAALNRVT